MRIATSMALATLAGLSIALPASAAERAVAEVDCMPTDQKLVYDCMISLMGRQSKAALEGAEIKVKAEMPNMPMAHGVAPVAAEPAGKPGMYKARLELEMHGEWALKLEVSGPTRDIVIKKVMFGSEGQAMGHGMKEGAEQPMKHGSGQGAMEGTGKSE